MMLSLMHDDAVHAVDNTAPGGPPLRTTVNLDDDLLTRAAELTGITDRTALLREALTTLIQRESARRLALLGGTFPEAAAAPRRRPPTSTDPE
jgi:Arc/MetJ family transcription regulator